MELITSVQIQSKLCGQSLAILKNFINPFLSSQANNIKAQQKMNTVSTITQVPILVYYNFRGQLQPLRNFFCYLEIPYFQLHLQRLEAQKSYLPLQVFAHFEKFKIDKSRIPTLIHGDLLIEGHLQIMTYICRRFNANELLGQTMQARKVKLQQILQIYFLKQPQSMLQFFKVADYASQNHTHKEITQYRYWQMITVLDSGYIKPICEYLHKQENPRYVFGKLTLLDFFFLQTCFYMVGCFDINDQAYNEEKKRMMVKQQVHEQKSPSFYFHIMENYLNSFTQEFFYIKNKRLLQNFKISSTMTSPERIRGLYKIWLADPNFIK